MTTTEILIKFNKIAVIGFSDNPYRDSKKIAHYLTDNGYTVYGVNPKLDGKNIDGIQCYKSISDIPDQIQIVDVFRASDAVPELVRDVLKLDYKPEVIWTQFGVINEEAKSLAMENGFEYIENKCILVEHSKL
jgi:uncharacterized protein